MKQYNMFAEKQKLDAQMNVALSEITKNGNEINHKAGGKKSGWNRTLDEREEKQKAKVV